MQLYTHAIIYNLFIDVNTLAVEGDDGLLEGRQKLQALGDETKRALKRNVYENYLKFIDAAKEISSELVNLLVVLVIIWVDVHDVNLNLLI